MSIQNLYDTEDKIVTKMGKGFLGERAVYRGKDIHHDLKDLSWVAYYVFGITGRIPTDQHTKMLNYIYISTSYADSSIWPNHIAALAGTARSTPSLGLSIGMAACEATLYGMTPSVRGIDYLIKASKAVEKGINLEAFIDDELAQHKVIYGYGRPLASTDERVPHVIQFAIDNGMADGKHMQIALETARILKKKKGLCTNIAAIYCALGADMGFSVKEFHQYMSMLLVAGTSPCYLEAKENKEGTFLPVRCDRIAYSGKKNLKW
jgi:citrate synthase